MMTNLARELRRGTLDLLLLRLLEDEEKYGYRLVTELGQRTGGLVEVREGTLYPVLYRLEDRGFIEPTWRQPECVVPRRGVPRKYYRITPDGVSHLEALASEWRSYVGVVESVLTGTDPVGRDSTDGADPAQSDSKEKEESK